MNLVFELGCLLLRELLFELLGFLLWMILSFVFVLLIVGGFLGGWFRLLGGRLRFLLGEENFVFLVGGWRNKLEKKLLLLQE